MNKLIAFTLLLFSLPSQAQTTTLDNIFKRLQETQQRGGSFIQTRQLQGLSIPISSQGIFFYAKDLGLYNEIRQPIFQAISYSRSGSMAWDINKQIIKTGKKTKTEKKISLLLLRFFEGDRNAINKLFVITLKSPPQVQGEQTSTAEGWTIQLTPKKKAMKQFMAEIIIQGQQEISDLRFHAANGDKTHIAFSDINNTPNVSAYCFAFPDTRSQHCNAH